MTITALPNAPQRNQLQDIFNENADLFLAALPTLVTELNAMGTLYNLATTTSSSTSNAIGTGSKTFTVASGLGFSSGMSIVVSNTGTPINSMYGQVVSYSGVTLVVSVGSFTGSGTFTAWSISLAIPNVGVLVGLRGNGGTSYAVNTVLTSADIGRPIYWNSGTGTLTLPDSSTIPVGSIIHVHNLPSATGALTILRSTTSTIFALGVSAASSVILLPSQSLVLITAANGNWIEFSANKNGGISGIVNYNSSLTLTSSDANKLLFSTLSAAQTWTLPDGSLLPEGSKISIFNAIGGFTLTLARQGTNTIYAYGTAGTGLTSLELAFGESIELVSRNTGAWVQSSASRRNTSVDCRQSVQYGALTSTGLPDLIPQSQVGNTLAVGVTLKGSVVPFMVSVGEGFNADGTQSNENRVYSSDVTLASLPASTTSYIFLDNLNGNISSQSLVDIWQNGGTISVVNNQITYDYSTHKCYVGNGSSANQVSWIVVAEVDTNATVVTAIRTRAYAGFYDSGFTNTLVAAAGTYTKNHNIGTKDITIKETIECITNETTLGYVVGDSFDNTVGTNASYSYAPAMNKLRNTVIVRRPSSAGYSIPHATTGVMTVLTAANWKYKIVAVRNF